MVTEINDKEVMTLHELKKKYSTKWFKYIIVGELNLKDPGKDMCYAILTADAEDELYQAHHPDWGKYHGGVTSGYNPPFTPEVGGIYVHA